VHNTVVGNNGAGIYLRDSRAVARNNILSRNGNQLRISGGSSSADRNLIDGGSDVQGSNPVHGSPQFVNPGIGDYHLASTSPAIDAGADVGVRNDIDGGSRPQGNGYDLGAYECAGQKPAPTATPQPTATSIPTSVPTEPAQPPATAQPTTEPTAAPKPTFVPSPVPSEPADAIIIDNSDSGFQVRSSEDGWETLESADGAHYGGSHAFNRQRGTGKDMARWSFSVPQPGIYEVYAWWWEGSWRPADVPYTIAHAFGSSTVRMNQQTNGGKWVLLGTFAFRNDGHVTISDNVSGGQDIVADAIKVQRVGELRWR
jgi:parallel beta-helix repeat protein